MPVLINPIARDLIMKFLVADPTKRLGIQGGVNEVKNHKWFRGVDWNLVLK